MGPNLYVSSGDLKNDDVEEPLSDMAKRFEPLLKRSNELVVMLQEKRAKEFYEQAFDESLKKTVTQADFEKLYGELLAKAGPFESYKPQQWKFREQVGAVGSTKIVHHQNGSIYYTFTFANTAATRLIGVHFNARAMNGAGQCGQPGDAGAAATLP